MGLGRTLISRSNTFLYDKTSGCAERGEFVPDFLPSLDVLDDLFGQLRRDLLN
jgi:hypothetical protein